MTTSYDLVAGAKTLQTKGGAKYRYIVENGELFRDYFQQNDDESKQIVVSVAFRKRMMEIADESIEEGSR